MREFEKSFVLFDTERSRSSAAIIDRQTANLTKSNGDTLEATHQLKRDAVGMNDCLRTGDFTTYARFMLKSWETQKGFVKVVTTSHIDQVYKAAMAAGALAGKVSKAGGGYMTLLVDPARRIEVILAMSRQEGRVTRCHKTTGGSEGWKTF